MVQIGAAEAGASRATAFRVEGRRVIGMASVAQIERTLAGEGLRGAAGAGRQHAIEHVDAAPDRADQIARLADPHQITWTVLRQDRRGRIDHREGGVLAFADRQPADRVAVEADLDEPRRRALPQTGVNAALDDTEDPEPRPRREGMARALGPAHRQFHRGFDRLALGGVGGALVERHRDVGAEQALDLDRALRGQQMPAAVEMRAKLDPLLADFSQGRQ